MDANRGFLVSREELHLIYQAIDTADPEIVDDVVFDVLGCLASRLLGDPNLLKEFYLLMDQCHMNLDMEGGVDLTQDNAYKARIREAAMELRER